jgi:hypothetical protein
VSNFLRSALAIFVLALWAPVIAIGYAARVVWSMLKLGWNSAEWVVTGRTAREGLIETSGSKTDELSEIVRACREKIDEIRGDAISGGSQKGDLDEKIAAEVRRIYGAVSREGDLIK